MGAYENPQAVVDRQSGQIWANTISGVTKATTDYIDFTRQKDDELAKKVQAQLDWALEYGLKKQDQVLANLNKLNADPSAFKIANELLDNIANSALNMKKASNNAELKKAQKENAAYSKRLTQLYNIIQADNASSQFYKDEFDPSIAGLQGGMSKSRPETPDYVAAQNVNTGLAAGSKEYYYDATTGSYRVKFSGENIDGTIDKDAMLFFNYDPGKVTDITSMITDSYKAQKFLDKNGDLTDKGLSKYEYVIPIKGTNYGSLHTKANTGTIATTMTPIIEAQAESFFQDPRAAQDIWAIIGKNSNKSFDDVELVKQNSPMQIEFKRAYTEYASKLIPNNKKLGRVPLASEDSGKGGVKIFNIRASLDNLDLMPDLTGPNVKGPLEGGRLVDMNMLEDVVEDMGFIISTSAERRSEDYQGKNQLRVKFAKTGKEQILDAGDNIFLIKAKLRHAAGDPRDVTIIAEEEKKLAEEKKKKEGDLKKGTNLNT